MEARTKAMISFAVLVVLLFGLYGFTDWFSKTTGYVFGEDEKVILAQCLDGKKTVFYVSETCPKCDEQLEYFGNTASDFLRVFECDDAETCPAEGGVPAWKINGEFYYGIRELNDLIEISGCDVEGS